MMKANKQIGFININEESIDKIIQNGDVVFERGFLREKTSTTLPINFGGVGKDLKDYKVYGNTVQNGTPTPDTPIDMVSCGDRTKNLFDKNNANVYGGYLNTSGVVSGSGNSGTDTIIFIKCKPNTTYALQKMLQPDTENNRLRIGCTSEIPVLGMQTTNFFKYNDGTTETQYVYKTSSTAKYLLFYCGKKSDTTSRQEILDSVQIEEGSTISSYEPYGYKIPINVKGNNLFKPIPTTSCGITSIVNPDGSITYSGTATNTWANITSHNYIDIEPGTYTFSIDKTLSYRLSIRLYYEDGSYDVKMILPGQKSTTFTLNKEAKHYYIYISNSLTVEEEYNETIYVQLEKGNTMTSFKPYYNQTTNIYLDEPLRKIDEYSDNIDFINGKVVRNIREIVLGSESSISALNNNESGAAQSSSNGAFMIYFSTNGIKNLKNSSVILNQFLYMYNSSIIDNISANRMQDKTACIRQGSNDRIYFRNTDWTGKTGNEVRDLFGITNLILNYILTTPTEESITLPNIPTVEGNNTLNIETEITPSQVYIKYKSNN